MAEEANNNGFKELTDNIEFLLSFVRSQVKTNEQFNNRIKELEDKAIYYSYGG